MDTTELTLAPTESLFTFTPGQYIELVYPNQPQLDDGGNHRSFSLAAAPTADGSLTIAFRNSSSAFKQGLLAAPLGTPLVAQGPYGVFTLAPEMEPVAFIAGGIGITPFYSILESGQTAHLLYANHDEARAAYLSELREWSKVGHLNLQEHYGPLTAEAVSRLVSTSRAKTYFIAGPLTMTNIAFEFLLEQGLARSQILIEQFTGYE
jgi:ferredoxin-NADP reductase